MNEEKRDSKGISLLRKGKRGAVYIIFSRTGIMLALLILQIMFLFGVFRWFEDFLPHVFGGTVLFTVIMVLYLLNSQIDPTAKITWLVVIMLLPVFGALFYWYTQSDLGHKTMKKRVDQLLSETKGLVSQSQETLDRLAAQDPGAAALARYIARSGGPVYENTTVTYFPMGEDKFEELLRQLEQAKDFIFLEYFIIDEGLMWGKILEILARKAKAGVDVRVMYDGTCEFSTLPYNYPRRLKELGIKCKAFAPITPLVSTHYNYRDHRKILVIDGHTAFNGGVNLADEYINHIEKYGHWKDTAVMLQGEAVKSFTLMFLQMWNVNEAKLEVSRFLNAPARTGVGFVIPYGDCPLDDDRLGERVYMDILNRAQKYVYIMSPYLILDSEMETALKFAAERGVDVRLILPGIPDKTAPYALAKTHYATLLDSGIQIYEYTPGFVHAKVFLADDREAVVGTINLDYRSLYHHFECATYMHSVPCLSEIKADFQNTIQSCRQVTRESIWQGRVGLRIMGTVLKAVAPLM